MYPPNIGPRGALLFVLATLLTPLSATADRIAIIGSGSVAGALGPEFAALGHEVIYGSRDPSQEKVQNLQMKNY